MICRKYLFPLFQWNACKLAKLSVCIAKCLATICINKIYITFFYIRMSRIIQHCIMQLMGKNATFVYMFHSFIKQMEAQVPIKG